MSNSGCVLTSFVRLPQVGYVTKTQWSQNGMVLGEDILLRMLLHTNR